MTRKKKVVIAVSIVALVALGLWFLLWPAIEAEVRLSTGVGLQDPKVETINPSGHVHEGVVTVGFDWRVPTTIGEREGAILEQRVVVLPADVQIKNFEIVIPGTERVELHIITRSEDQLLSLLDTLDSGMQRSIIESRRTERLPVRRVDIEGYTGYVEYRYRVYTSELDVQSVLYTMVGKGHVFNLSFFKPDPDVFTYDMYDTIVATVLSGVDWETFKRKVDEE